MQFRILPPPTMAAMDSGVRHVPEWLPHGDGDMDALRPKDMEKMLSVLRAMIQAEETGEYEDAEIVCSGRECWLGLDKVASRTVDRLLGCMAISDISDDRRTQRYVINGTGRAIVEDPSVADAVVEALRRGGAFDERGRPIID
jgi:hypothetical protein